MIFQTLLIMVRIKILKKYVIPVQAGVSLPDFSGLQATQE